MKQSTLFRGILYAALVIFLSCTKPVNEDLRPVDQKKFKEMIKFMEIYGTNIPWTDTLNCSWFIEKIVFDGRSYAKIRSSGSGETGIFYEKNNMYSRPMFPDFTEDEQNVRFFILGTSWKWGKVISPDLTIRSKSGEVFTWEECPITVSNGNEPTKPIPAVFIPATPQKIDIFLK